MNREIKSLPMVALRGMTIMPEMVVHFDVSREKSIAAIQEAMAGDQKIFLVAQKSIETDDPTQEDVYEVGTVGTIKTDHEASKAYRPGTCFRRNKRNLKTASAGYAVSAGRGRGDR